MAKMIKPQLKVNVTHGGTSTDYTPLPFCEAKIKRRENNYDVATLTFIDKYWQYYEDSFTKLDEIKVYLYDAARETSASAVQIFGGYIRDIYPVVNSQGLKSQVACKGYGAALEATNCNKDYGEESKNATLDTIKEAIADIVDNMVNKSLGSADNTGYAIARSSGGGGVASTIADLYSATKIKYINNPYRSNIDALNTILNLSSAIGAGSTAGGHWIVDNSQNLLVNTIGAHENTTEWPDWWNTDQTGSTLTQGADFEEFKIDDKSEEFANKVILITDFRRPAYDFWTEGQAANWGNFNGLTITDDAGTKVVGDYSLKLATAANGNGEAYWPSGANAGWDVTKWGSIKHSPPRLNFYMYHDSTANDALVRVKLFTARADSFFYIYLTTWADADNTWTHHSIPIGLYYPSQDESKIYKWSEENSGGAPSWSNINGFSIYLIGSGIPPQATSLYIDDLHFSGKIIREAKNSTNITANKEYQKVFIARNAMDDSCVASDDSGFAGRIAYAELLRRQAVPKTIQFTTETDMKAALAGQKLHLHACKKRDGTFRRDETMRISELEINVTGQKAFFTATATSDLLNSFAISLPDQYKIWQENFFVHSAEAKNMRSGSEVDLLISRLAKDYPS